MESSGVRIAAARTLCVNDSVAKRVAPSTLASIVPRDVVSVSKQHPLEARVLDGRYRLVTLIGSGGGGSVFEAEDLRHGTRVAVKISKGSPSSVERIRREARIVSLVRHPNICAVLDVGLCSDVGPYVVFERLEGETLAERMRRNTRGMGDRAFPIFTQILDALRAAHALSIVHRDLKPENVFVVMEAGYEPVVKLLDFGLAKRTFAQNEDPRITRQGQAVGTYRYMAPEQMRALTIDHAVDVFAFGVMLFEALTGRHPFPVETSVDCRVAMLTNPPIALRRLRPDLSELLERLVARCLERDPRDRPSVGALRLGLERSRNAVLARPQARTPPRTSPSSSSSSHT